MYKKYKYINRYTNSEESNFNQILYKQKSDAIKMLKYVFHL